MYEDGETLHVVVICSSLKGEIKLIQYNDIKMLKLQINKDLQKFISIFIHIIYNLSVIIPE